MISVTRLVWQAAGAPSQEGTTAGICRLCGDDAVGMPFRDWVRPTFSNFDLLKQGTICCHACQFCCADNSVHLQRHLGLEKAPHMRNYSHFVVGGAWYPLSKAQKREMFALLCQFPELAVIAESGQKHLIFRARPGWWQFEEAQIMPSLYELRTLLTNIESLYVGFSKAEIMTASYAQHRIISFGMQNWHDLESQIRPHRGSALFNLALFLAQKEKEDDGIARQSGDVASAGVARHQQHVQESLSRDDLAAVRGSDTQRGVHRKPDEVYQLALFED